MLTLTVLTVPSSASATAQRPTSCPTYEKLALAVGWHKTQLPRLTHVMARESSCFPRAWNKADPYSGSYCLTQLNGSWKGSFRRAGLINKTMTELFNPTKCLRAALWIFDRSGWQPWGFNTKGKK